METVKIYTGIGSRDCPDSVLKIIEDFAFYLGYQGWILRSGGADGCDTAFETGARKFTKEIYLPWRYFNNSVSDLYPENFSNFYKAKQLMSTIHPTWTSLNDSVKKLHARNCYQVLGNALNSPSKMIVCYCPIKNDKYQGGTATALNLAEKYNIPIINLFLKQHLLQVTNKIKKV